MEDKWKASFVTELPAGEKVVAMCAYKGTVLVATERCVYGIYDGVFKKMRFKEYKPK